MAKMLSGIVVSTAMKQTVVVEVTRKTPHPLYKKLLKQSKKYKVALNGKTVQVGGGVTIVETKPSSKGKYFAIASVIAKNEKPASAKPGTVRNLAEQNSQETSERDVLDPASTSTKKTTRRKTKKETA